jgi:hypothetical protein
MRIPEQMSSMMSLFFSNLIPYFVFLWSLGLLLFYRTLYRDMYDVQEPFTKTLPALICLITALIFLLLPIRSCINKCYEGRQVFGREETYEVKFAEFPTDYDRENPVTKNEGIIRVMQKKLEGCKNEEQRKEMQK